MRVFKGRFSSYPKVKMVSMQEKQIPQYHSHNFGTLVQITDKAIEKISQLLSQEQSVEAVRIYITGGGCSGMSYSMSFAKEKKEQDAEIKKDGAKLYIDPIALSLLTGVEIDYQDDELSSSFVFNNSFNMIGGTGGCTSCGSSQA